MPSAVPSSPSADTSGTETNVKNSPPNDKNDSDDTVMADDSIDASVVAPPKDPDETSTACRAEESMEVEPTQAEEETSYENSNNVNDTAAAKETADEPEATKGGEEMEVEKNDNERETIDDETVPEAKIDKEDKFDWKDHKKLGEVFDVALDRLQEHMSASILTLRSDDHEQSQNTLTDDKQKKSNAIYASLADSAKEAFHALVCYGSKVDLSSKSSNSESSLSETRRSRLLSTGKNIWMTIRSNPELFEDTVSEELIENGGGDYLVFEGKKYQAVAGGYARAVAAQLVFLSYIDTRCKPGCPPSLHAALEESEVKPSVKELVFGVKVFSRAGKAILKHSKQDPQASHNVFSLSISCFHMINKMAVTNGEAAEEIKDLLDEAFDAFSSLSSAAAQFADFVGKSSDNECVMDWPSLVIDHLKEAKDFCSLSSGDGRLTVSKVAILQRYLPSLARICYKHGSQLIKIDKPDHATSALQIALETTNSCLAEVREAIERENNPLNEVNDRKAKGLQMQVLHNLEADLVVVSIEAFYVLSHIFQSSGKQEKALQCLDQIERYMKEQKERDDELYATAMSKVDKDFLFSEGDLTALGPKMQDKQDIKTRASTVRANAKKRFTQEKATLAFCRLMIYHKAQPCPSLEEEALIDKLIHELADLSNFVKDSKSAVSSAEYALSMGSDGKSLVGSDHVFSLTLNALRLVHVRRMLSNSQNQEELDLYNILLDKMSKSDPRRPFVLLDRLNAILTARFQMEDNETRRALDKKSLHLAHECITTVKSLFDQSGNLDSTSTLFGASFKSIYNELLQETKAHFARGLSLYHSSNAHTLCAQYAEQLETILRLTSDDPSYSDYETANCQLGEVIAIKAYALSMGGDSADAYKAARDAWEKIKNIDTLVTLFHCSLRHEVNYSTCDSLLELDTAINDLSLSYPKADDEVLAAFPRLSNSCVDSGKGVGELVLLGLQERWTKMLVASKMLHDVLHEKIDVKNNDELRGHGGHSLFEVFSAYLENFEHVITIQREKDQEKISHHCETLLQVITTVLGFVVTNLRDSKAHGSRTNGRIRKENEPEFVLVWDNDVVKKLIGNRADCVWVAEQLWNLANKLMMSSFGATGSDTRKYSSELFAGAHDFCLLSEEEQGEALSKDFLDIDVQVDNMLTPTFNTDHDRTHCDISSEFSGQCLLLASATAVDSTSSSFSTPSTKTLLRRTLHRLAYAQDEFQLNSEDEAQKKDVNKMIALLTLRCLLGIEDDALARAILVTGNLEKVVLELCNDEPLNNADDQLSGVLQNVYTIACVAGEKKMIAFGATLQRICARHMSRMGKFVLHVDKQFSLSLAEIQRKAIQSASTTKEMVEVYNDIGALVNKYKEENSDASANSSSQEDFSFYSKDDLDWFAIESHNQGVSLSLLGDHQNAGTLFAAALNLIPMCSKEVQCHTKSMNAALTNSLSKHSSIGQSISSFIGNQSGL